VQVVRVFRKFISSLLITTLLFFQGLIYPIIPFVTPVHAAIIGTFSANETVANATTGAAIQTFTNASITPNDPAGANTQTNVTAETQANVSEVKATRILTVGVLPANADTITIGSCAVTFTTTASSTADDTDCAGGAIIDTNLDAGDTNRTIDEIAATLRSLSNVADAAHGNLTVGGSGTTASFTTTNTENSASDITFTDGTGGDITATTTTTGVIPVAQVSTVTPANIEVGDVFTATINGLAVNFTATAGTVVNVTDGLTTAINASAQASNVTAVDNTTEVQITSDSAGTSFTITSGTTNYAGVKQVDDLTPSNIEVGDIFTVTDVSTDPVNVTATSTSAMTLVNSLVTAVNGATGVTVASNSANKLRLTANVAGTGFTVIPSTTNRVAVAQVVTFTPANVTAGETFRAIINGTNYDYLADSGNTVDTVVSALALLMDANAAADCTEDNNTKVTCTASAAGTAFTDDVPNAATVFDITAPAAPSIPNLDDASDSGTSNSDNITSDTTPTFSGTAESSSTVKLYDSDGTTEIGSGTATGGDYSITTSALSDGVHSITAKTTDTENNTSAASSALDVTINTSAPSAVVTYSINSAVKDTDTLVITATFSEDIVNTPKIAITGSDTLAATDMTFSSATVFTYSHNVGTGNGTATVALSVGEDAAGNVVTSAPTTGATFTVDNSVPTISSITTKDTSGDGRVETATIVFNEAVDDSTFSADDFTIAGAAVTSFNFGTADDDSFDVIVNGGVAGTEAKQVTYTQGTGADLADNLLANVANGDESETDGASPVLLSARTFSTTQIDLTFSEDLDGASLAMSDFTVSGYTLTGGVSEPSAGVARLTVSSAFATNATPAVSVVGTVPDLASNNAITVSNVIPTDGVAPVLSPVSIASDNTISALFGKIGATVILTFTASETINAPTVTITGSSVTPTNPSGNNWIAAYELTIANSEEVVPFNISFSDTSANSGTPVTATTNSSSVTFDKTVPTIPGMPSTTTPTNSSPQNWSWTASSDVLSGFYLYNWRAVQGVTEVTGTSNINSALSSLVEGIWNFFVKAIDNAGNESAESSVGTVTVDQTQPDTFLTAYSPDPSKDNTPTYTGTATDEATNITGVEYRVDGGSWTAASATDGLFDSTSENFTFTISTLSDDTHIIEIRATDEAVNVETSFASDTLLVDTTVPDAPTITLLDPIYIGNQEAVTITGTGEADATFTYTITDTDLNVVSGNGVVGGDESITINAIDVSTLVDGELTASVTLTDAAGNSGSAGTAIATKDTVAPDLPGVPTVGGDNLVNYDEWNDGSIIVEGTADAGSLVTVNIEDDCGSSTSGSEQLLGGATDYSITTSADLCDGPYYVSVTATDAAGNISSTQDGASVTQDTEAPTLSPVSIASSNSNSSFARVGHTVTVSFTSDETIQDPIVTIAEQSATLNLQIGTEWSVYYTMTANETAGNVPFTIDFSDLAGNPGEQVSAADNSPVIFDKTAPEITEVTLKYAGTSNDALVVQNEDVLTLTATVTDDANQVEMMPEDISADFTGLGGTIGVNNPTSYIDGVATWDDIEVSGTIDEDITVTVDANDPASNPANQGSIITDANNSTPVGVTDSVTVVEDTDLDIPTSDLLENDTDAGEDSLTITAVFNAVHGTVSLSGSTITFTPEAGYIDNEASFTYTVSDGFLSATGTVNVTVNPPVAEDEVLLEPETEVDSSHPNIVVGETDEDSTITIPAGVNNATIDLSNLIETSGGNDEVTLDNSITLESDTSVGEVSIEIPAGITISGPSSTWDGVVNAPQIQANSSVAIGSLSGSTSTQILSVIEVGFGDILLTFDKAVKIVIEGGNQVPVGYSRAGIFTEITNTCIDNSQAGNDANLAAGAECKIYVGGDAVIWTKHFTKFVTFSKTDGASVPQPGAPTYNSTPPVCNDSKPGGAPSFVSAQAGTNSVTLTWTGAPDPVTYYLITYGTTTGAQTYGNPNVGGKGSTSYTVGNLSGGQTYYFRIRAGNGCAPGSYSGEISATPGGGTVSGTAPGFAEGVLGAKAQATNDGVIQEVSGEQTITIPGVSSEVQQTPKLGFFGAIWKFILSLFGR